MKKDLKMDKRKAIKKDMMMAITMEQSLDNVRVIKVDMVMPNNLKRDVSIVVEEVLKLVACVMERAVSIVIIRVWKHVISAKVQVFVKFSYTTA